MLQTDDILRLSHKVGFSGHWYLRLRDNTLSWSDEIFRLHGLPPEGPQPGLDEALRYYHAADRDRVQSSLYETIETGRPLSFEARILRADGEVRWVEVLGEIKKGTDSETEYLFGILRDITENQHERLHNERLAWILENTEEVILMTDTAGRITWSNAAFESISGYTLEEARGRSPGELLQGPETDPETVQFMRDHLSRSEGFKCELLNYNKSGTSYWLRISCQPEIDADGNLRGFTAIQTDITEEKRIRLDLEAEIKARTRLEHQLRHLATHDELSGLPNRRYFMQKANEEIERANRHRRDLSLLVCDLDYFKEINDRYGHQAGDDAIRAFAERCRSLLRESDTPARVGGEEFAVLLPETDHGDAIKTAERLRKAVAETPVDTGAGPVMLTVSIGVTSYREDFQSVESMIHEADTRLYKAKRGGRNQVV